ncbi:MAG: AraC family transcriptional regulator [Microbacterium sp.]|jgi:AraC-like DNA-binding protein|uniref:AraC family transcriptional regulator n=1 Tax=Microbacterium ginsengisoli TaxID=400772 RepID=A0A0F0LSP8_9MICO|nr:Regulatory protein SoxS [Microbacterium ginsengisoli]MAL06532.1 AraC family transcriptional regulator [Microbacterium sp.]ODU73128.1 MAG: hypothetical protein ABT08_11955 [Microbacterium sp. SCN 71-21]HAN25347.1 AraC family transcriptional regulator [Microbacterium ginsengisoli]
MGVVTSDRALRVPPALTGAPLVRTDDAGVAAGALHDLLGRGVVAPHDARERLDLVVAARRFGTVTLAHLDVGAAATVDVPASADAVTVHMNQARTSTTRVAGNELTTSSVQAVVVSPGMPVRLELAPESPRLLVRVERRAVEDALARMLGRRLDEPVRFAPLFDLSGPETIRWSIAVQLLSTESMMDASLLQAPLGRQSIEDLLVSSLLLLQPSNHSPLLQAPTSGTALMQDALDHIERHLAEPFSIDDLAAAVHASARHVQQTFRARLGTTPGAYVRRQRLLRVRADLLAGDARRGTSVAGVAERWGFGHGGRFAGWYREEFGETPAETLHRG